MCVCSNSRNIVRPSKISRSYRPHSSFSMITQVFPFWTGTLVLHGINIWIPALVCTLLLPANGWAWERNTHEELTEKTIETIEANLDAYLINNLGLERGLNDSVEGGTPRKLMIRGSNTEDDGIRSVNHFHEPLSNQGLRSFRGISAVKWSLSDLGEQHWSWNDAREYYFKALTSSTKAERDEYWGKTFRALGQVMHLLQDSANPAHVRNDTHLFVDGLHDYMARHHVGSYLGGGIFSPDPSMLDKAGPAGPNGEPFANLFDREKYHGSAPRGTLGSDIGVTEYTNANFFSDDTIPGQGSIFSTEIPHPTVAELVPAPVPSPYLTLPRLGSNAFPGARAAKLTGNEAVARFLLTHTHLDLLGQLQLDDAVYEGQSITLIPRAVGYSAAVLDYFFRGDLQVTSSAQCHEPGLNNTQFWVDFALGNPEHYHEGGFFSLYFEPPDGGWVLENQIPWSVVAEQDSTRMTGGYPGPATTVRLALVYEGPLGPSGATEKRGIVGQAQKITTFFQPCLQ